MKRATKILLPVLIIVAGFLIMIALMSFRTEPPRREAQLQPRVVEARQVALTDVTSEVVAYGRVTSSEPVDLYSEVSGVLTEGNVPFRPAQSFKRGDLLVKVDDRQARFQLNSTKSELMTALASVLPEIKLDFPEEYQTWQDYFNRCSFDAELSPLPETENPKVKLFLSRFNVYKLYFSVRDQEVKLEKHHFYAPFDGSIVSVDLRVGASARSGSRLGQIISLEDLEVELSVPAEDRGWIRVGQVVTLTSTESSSHWRGTVRRAGSAIDERTQTVPVYVSVQQTASSALLDGTYLKARIPGRVVSDAVSIPRKALYDEKYIYVISDGKLVSREVSIARKENDSVIIDAGLNAGDTVVVQPLQGVAPGMPATPKLASAEGGSR